jgi:hypothetical protein
MEDVWKIFFGQYKKYMSEYKTYICVNQYHNSIPSEYIQVYYDDSKTYKLTKALGVKYCLEMIKQFPEWVEKFNSHKKKDDLADCFLQGMYALINKL